MNTNFGFGILVKCEKKKIYLNIINCEIKMFGGLSCHDMVAFTYIGIQTGNTVIYQHAYLLKAYQTTH